MKFTVSTLGKNGRWGNELFQYCFAKGLSEYYGVPLEIPKDCNIRKVFQIDDLVMSGTCQNAAQTAIDQIPPKEAFKDYEVIDLYGYWQFQDAINFYSRSKVKEWLKFQPWVYSIDSKCRSHLSTSIVRHKRRGDYVRQQNLYCCIKDESFDRITTAIISDLAEMGNSCHVIDLTEESPKVDLLCENLGVPFLSDFMQMVYADIVVRSNSTFSWWGSVLGNNYVYSPVVEDLVGWQDVAFIKGNHPKMASSKIHIGSKLTDLYLRD